VFGVWLTVGFFEVVNDSASPPELGQEIGLREGRHIRHRMFALVDRTFQMTTSRSGIKGSTTSTSPVPGGGGPFGVGVAGGPNIHPNTPIKIYRTETVTPPPTPIFGPGGKIIGYKQGSPYQVRMNEESTTVTSVDPPISPTTITAVFRKPHPSGSTIEFTYPSVGMPYYNTEARPTRFTPTSRPGLVPFFSVIK
jgi:hypothetical protein